MPVDVELQLFCSKSWGYLLINFIFRNICALCCISEHIRATTNDYLLLSIDLCILFFDYSTSCLVCKILESGGKWLLKPKMTSSNVWFCPPDRDIHSAVTEEERDQNIFTFKKQELGEFIPFFSLKNYSNRLIGHQNWYPDWYMCWFLHK